MRIRELRNLKGITMKELGDIVGVSESTISLYEKGTRNPSLAVLLKLSNYFCCSIDDLVNLDKIENDIELLNIKIQDAKIINDKIEYENLQNRLEALQCQRNEYLALKNKIKQNNVVNKQTSSHYTTQEQKLIELYRKLPKEKQVQVLEFVEFLSESTNRMPSLTTLDGSKKNII